MFAFSCCYDFVLSIFWRKKKRKEKESAPSLFVDTSLTSGTGLCTTIHPYGTCTSSANARNEKRCNNFSRCLQHFYFLTLVIDKWQGWRHRWRIVFDCGCRNTHRGLRTPIPNQSNTHGEPPTPTTSIRVSRTDKALFQQTLYHGSNLHATGKLDGCDGHC